jgi:hypothetical protein
MTHSSVGAGLGTPGKHVFDSVFHALSEDGSRLFWSAQIEDPSLAVHAASVAPGPSKLFLRLNPAEPQSEFANGSATGSGQLTGGSNLVNFTPGTGAFEVGQEISGAGIPFGTTILGVAGSTLTLSNNATANGKGVALEAFSECTEPEKACTLPLSTGAAIFRGATPTGSKALFTEGEDLYQYEAGSRTLMAHKVKGVMGASSDLSRIYLVSEEALAAGASAGKFNLYLHEAGGGFRFVATLLESGWQSTPSRAEDNASSDVRSISPFPVNRSSRVSGDGLHAVFMSESLALAKKTTNYDNTDATSGQADSEVYLYDAGAEGGSGKLLCISCNPSGARPQGAPLKTKDGAEEAWAAGLIPGWETQWYPSRVLSADGKRLFFESFDGLVARDTNGREDVYEWEQAAGGKECEEVGAETFVAGAGGCLSLISSGLSPGDSEFIDASASGSDVFFSTASSLLPQDYGLIDIYDAREGGGFPAPPQPQPPCEGEACQSPPAAPNDATPASSSFEGQGNVKEESKKPHKHKHKKHKHKRRHKRRHGRVGR